MTPSEPSGSEYAAHRKYRFVLDHKEHEWPSASITGLQLKQLAHVDPQTYGVWEEVHGGEDRPIADGESVDLAGPGMKHFFTAKKSTTEG